MLNLLDAYTTTVALRTGRAREANPVLAPFAQDAGALAAAKIAMTASTIVMARRAWTHSPPAGVAIMVIGNALTGFVVTHNAMVVGNASAGTR